MAKIFTLLTGIIIGILATLWFQERQKNEDIYQQSQVLLENVKHLNKMVVAEAYYNEVYSYKDSDKYLFDLLQFDKNAILLVTAKAQISYDLNQMKIRLDSVHKIIYITNLPKEQVEIFPHIQYYDLQQSTINQFDKDDMNKMNTDAVEKIKSHIDLTQLRLKAKKQLLENLQNLYALSKIYGWTVKDNHLKKNLESDLILFKNWDFKKTI